MNYEERLEWIEGLKKELEKLADQTFNLEQKDKSHTPGFKQLFLQFTKKLSLYEKASKKHDLLSKEEKNGIK